MGITNVLSLGIADFEVWKNIAAWVGVIAALATAVSVVTQKIFDPIGKFAKAIASAVRHEFHESVELVFLSSDVVDQHIREVTQEEVAHEISQITTVLHDHEARLERIEKNTEFVKNRMAERTPRQPWNRSD